jgi:hypothetical protein
MTEPSDFIVYNMPGMLGRRVVKRDPSDPSKWVRDESWYESVRQQMSALFAFFARNQLLSNPAALPEVEKVVLRMSEFSELGQKFVMSCAADRWLASFDRPGSKKDPTNTAYLEKQLATLRQKGAK